MSTVPIFDPCPPVLFPPDPPQVLPAAPTSHQCFGEGVYLGWLLNEDGVDFILQEDGISLIAL